MKRVPSDEYPAPVALSRDELVDLGGWAVLKEARGLVEAGAVKELAWEGKLLRGSIQLGGQPFYPRLNLRSLTFAESQCNCRLGRQGFVCAHAIALCLRSAELERNAELESQERDRNDEPEGHPPSDPRPQSLVLSQAKGLPLDLRILLPPNLSRVASRDAIAVKIDARISSQWIPLEKIDRGRAYRISQTEKVALALVESWCGGQLHGLIQLKRSQLGELLQCVSGQPIAFWANRPDVALVWEDRTLQGVHEFLKKEQPLLEPAHANQPEKPARIGRQPDIDIGRSLPNSPDRSLAVDQAGAVTVDGSTQYLAITVHSREHPHYREIINLLRTSGFRLEPSNRRWWMRDRHKTLAFLAEYRNQLETRFGATFTPNFRERSTALQSVAVTCSIRADGEDYAVHLKLEAGPIDESAIHSALTRGSPYVEDGERIYLIEPHVVSRLESVQQSLSGERHRSVTTSFRKRLQTRDLRDAEDLIEEVTGSVETPESWQKRSAALKGVGNLRPAPVPEALDKRLRSYQRIGTAWMWHLYGHGLAGILADEMGLGKTIQALALIACVRQWRSADSSILVVAPAGLLENWRREALRFVPELRAFVHHREKRLSESGAFRDWDLVITSYGTLARDLNLFRCVRFSLVCVDEAQHVRNRATLHARALCELQTQGKVMLTGTPIENTLEDVRSLFAFLMPGYLERVPSGIRGEDRAWYDQRHLVKVAPYLLRRRKSSVAPELPARIEQTIYCRLTPEQSERYRRYYETEQRRIFELEMSGASEQRVRFAALTLLLRLRQICADPRLVDPEAKPSESGKLAVFRELVDEALAEGHRVLVFSQFVSMLSLLRSHLEEGAIPYLYMDGSTRDRVELAEQFNMDSTFPVFLISLKAGGIGLNLTGADTVIHYDPWWNPAVESQATDRAHRIGQTKVVTSMRLVMAESVEERVLALQSSKRALLDELLDAGESAGANVGLDDVKEILGF